MSQKTTKTSHQSIWRRVVHPDIQKTLAVNPEAYSPQISESRLASLRYAIAGWLHMLRYQKNTRIQAGASIIVLIVSMWLRIPARDLAVIVSVIGLVWMAEFLNAGIEAAVNLAMPEMHPMARVGKDVAAAAVLLGVIVSVVVGLLILGPPLWERLGL